MPQHIKRPTDQDRFALRILHRLTVRQVCDPDQRGFAAQLEVHAEVCHQHGRARVIGFVIAVERGAELGARQLDDVEARVG